MTFSMTFSDLWMSFEVLWTVWLDVIREQLFLLSYSTGRTVNPMWCWARPVSDS